GQHWCLLWRRSQELAEGSIVASDLLFQRFHQILHDMEPIRHRDGLRRRLSNGSGIPPRAVTTDDLNAGILPKPLLDCRRFSIWEEVNGSATFQVNQERSIAIPFT